MKEIRIIGIKLPEVREGDDIAKLILASLKEEGLELQDNDVVVITSKTISKAKGYLEKINEVTPSLSSRILSKILGKSPQLIELY